MKICLLANLMLYHIWQSGFKFDRQILNLELRDPYQILRGSYSRFVYAHMSGKTRIGSQKKFILMLVGQCTF